MCYRNWLSKRLGVLQLNEVTLIRQRAQTSRIGAKASGEVDQAMAEVDAVTMVDMGVEGQEVEDCWVDVVLDQEDTIHWLVINVGCVAIWPMTILAPHHSYRC